MRKAVAALIFIAALTLVGCGNRESPDERNIRIGKACVDAGGAWTWSDWTGYHCNINAKETP